MKAPPDPVLRFEGVTKRFGSRLVLQSIDMELRPGKMVALVGPNGAGKSTIVKLACGLLAPDQGQVDLCGTEPSSLPARRLARLAAYLPQSYPTDLPHDGLELVLTGRRAYLGPFGFERPQDRSICLSVMEELDVRSLADRTVSTLSGGELQMLMAASALAQNATILLADEPTSDLDPVRQKHLLTVLRKRCINDGLAVLAAVHDMNLAVAWFDEIILLGQGVIVSQGPPRRVLVPSVIERLYPGALVLEELSHRPVLLPKGPKQEDA